jgi:hypothetical protein
MHPESNKNRPVDYAVSVLPACSVSSADFGVSPIFVFEPSIVFAFVLLAAPLLLNTITPFPAPSWGEPLQILPKESLQPSHQASTVG